MFEWFPLFLLLSLVCGAALAIVVGGCWLVIAGVRDLNREHPHGLPIRRFAEALILILLGGLLVLSVPAFCIWTLRSDRQIVQARSQIVLGQTQDEVRSILGRPNTIRQNGTIWSYTIMHGEVGVEFGDDGRVKNTWIAD